MSMLLDKRERLLDSLRAFGSCAVAFSGGVDSAVVAMAAQLALGERAVAVTGVSSSLAAGELELAELLAKRIGIRHIVLRTQEFADPNYLQNAPDRCYHCKTELYIQLEKLAEQLNFAVIVNGTNADDLGDYRPGLRAGTEHRVRSPLAEEGITKDEVRKLAAEWHLPVWDKPASPCLSSRVAYGEEVTPDRLRMIDQAEQFLRELGFQIVRVRFHKNNLARLELSSADLPRLFAPQVLGNVTQKLKSLGFRFVTVDLEGFRSGSLNSLVPLTVL